MDSLFAQDYKDFEVIVVDNGSKDDTVSFIKENYPRVSLIENKENLGAAKARNQGIKIAHGEWILTLDCDVVLEKYFLKKIMQFAQETEECVGMLQPKILRDNKKIIYSCGISLSKLKRFYDIGKGELNNGKFNRTRYIFGACSAAAVYRKEMLEELKDENGYFDERFFFLAEDVDLSWRAQRRGWKALYYPQAVCYHDGNSSSTNMALRQFLCWRNRKLILQKNRINKFKLAAISLFYDFPRLLYLFLTNIHIRKYLSEVYERE